jgi:hypothetical protein
MPLAYIRGEIHYRATRVLLQWARKVRAMKKANGGPSKALFVIGFGILVLSILADPEIRFRTGGQAWAEETWQHVVLLYNSDGKGKIEPCG